MKAAYTLFIGAAVIFSPVLVQAFGASSYDTYNSDSIREVARSATDTGFDATVPPLSETALTVHTETQSSSTEATGTDLQRHGDRTSTSDSSRVNGLGRLASDSIVAFADDFSTDPNTNGLWRIHRAYPSDTTNEAAWDAGAGNLYLTRAVNSHAAAIFANYQLQSRRWQAQFRYKVGGGSGADGMTFMFYKDESLYGQPCAGGYIGFQLAIGGIPGYGIELDGWQNRGDPSADHIALLKDTAATHLA